MEQFDVSVIIPSHRQGRICGVLELLRRQECAGTTFEVIVVADYPVDNLRAGYPWVTWIHIDEKSIPDKRNCGILHSQGAVVAFCDDDCLPSAGWVHSGYAYLVQHPECVGVEGKTMIRMPHTAAGALGEYRRLEERGYRTNNIFYRKSIFFEVALFDERFMFQREDVDIAFTFLETGLTIAYSEEVRVEHLYRPHEHWDLVKNCYNRRFDPLLFDKHDIMYRRHIHTPVPGSIRALFLVHCMVLVILLAFSPYVVPALLLDGMVAAILTWRRMRRGGQRVREGIVYEFVSVLCAPLVLLGSLLYGSLRYRRLLVV